MTAAPPRLALEPEPVPVPPARVVLIDVRPERLRVMRTLLEKSALVVVVGEADTKYGAIEEVGQASADVAIVEIQMPVDEGLATVALLRQHFPQLRIVVCSFDQNAATRRQAAEHGSDAYIGKPIDLGRFADLLQLFASTTRDPADASVSGGQKVP